MEIVVDQEFKALIPPLATEEKQQLEANIKQDGCRDPLVVWRPLSWKPEDCAFMLFWDMPDDVDYDDGKEVKRWCVDDREDYTSYDWPLFLIDGHNRYEICTRLNIPFDTAEVQFADRDAAKIWMIDNQKGRRNLTDGWKFELAQAKKSILEPIGKANKIEGGKQGRAKQLGVLSKVDKSPEHNTREEIAKDLGWSTGKVAMADKVWKSASPEIKEAVKTGDVSINQAYQEVRKEEKKAKQEEAIQERRRVVEKVGLASPVKSKKTTERGEVWVLGDHLLFVGDTSTEPFKSLLGRHQLAFADPPYGAGKSGYDDSKFYWEHDYLADFSDIVVVTPGIVSVFEFARKTQMPYAWSIACWLSNGMTRGAIGFGNWIYGAVFSHGSVFRQKQDFCKASISTSETLDTSHTTRKPTEFMAYVIETFTVKGDSVVDPFLGSGQTLLTCETMGRRCVGGEIDPKFCDEIISRWETMSGKEAVKR